MSKQSSNWVFTLNNYTEEDLKDLTTWTEKGAGGVAYAKEVGASGTPHLQGYVHMKSKARLKKMKELSKKCHWEVMKGKLIDSEKYCSKQGQLVILGKYNRSGAPASRLATTQKSESSSFWFF